MPELPEVENYRIYLEDTSMNRLITGIEIVDQRLIKVPEDVLQNELINKSFVSSRRIGKYLFISTSGTQILVVHFGLTGNLEFYKDVEDRPKYAQVLFHFNDGFTLAYLSRRKFGWIDLANDIENFRKTKKLGRDATEIAFEEFYEPIKKSKAPIKSKLLDQKYFAGIGNWIADEILYQSKLHPKSMAYRLTKQDFKLLFEKMQHILAVALQHHAVFEEFPEYFLIHNRKDGGTCYHTGDDLVRIEVGGRGSYVSPEWQEKK